MPRISVRADIRSVKRTIDAAAKKQIPFATALALTATAKAVQAAETKLILETFPTATPFTQKSVSFRGATKASPRAQVFVKDIAAAYLLPFVTGGRHDLGSKLGLLVPKNIGLNRYGNLPRAAIEKLKARPDVFIGPVKTKNGEVINGVWQRPVDTSRVTLLNAKGKRLGKLNRLAAGQTAHLKLLVRFEDPLSVKQRLPFQETARAIVTATFGPELRKALAKALATARR